MSLSESISDLTSPDDQPSSPPVDPNLLRLRAELDDFFEIAGEEHREDRRRGHLDGQVVNQIERASVRSRLGETRREAADVGCRQLLDVPLERPHGSRREAPAREIPILQVVR